MFLFFMQKTAYEMRISDWSSDVCSSDLLDLSVPDGQAVFHDLVRTAYAVTGNLRGDVPAKLGLTYETLGRVKPEIVCGHLTAYGRSGPRAAWPEIGRASCRERVCPYV